MPLRLYPRSRHRSTRQSRRPAWWRNAFRIVGASRQRVGDVDGGAVEQADQLGVEPGGAVLAAPQLVVLGIGPARRDGAVDQAHSTLDQVDRLGHSRHELLHHGPHDRPGWPRNSTRSAARYPATNSCEQFCRKYVRSRSLVTTHTISGDHSLVPRLGQRIVHLSHQLHLRQHQTGGMVMVTVLRASRILWEDLSNSPARTLPSVAARRSPTTFLASGQGYGKVVN